MLKQEKVNDFFQEFVKLLPDDLRRYKDDVDKNIKAALNATLVRMDLVTREEFDIQTTLLGKTRALVQDLEKKVIELESKIKQQE